MKKLLLATLMILTAFTAFSASKKKKADSNELKINYKQRIPEGDPVEFKEIWGWVMREREEELDNEYPLTDVGYFSAEVNSYGELDNIPIRSKLIGFPGRVHLVLVCDSRALTHFVLDPKYELFEKMIKDVMVAAKEFDGINVDYELIPGRDAANFITFLERLSEECKKAGKMFTVCVPARVKTISDDIFPYKKIASISDRVMIMAYDEHWSTSRPGAIASTPWCKKIVDYAVTVIPQEKLVMGIPFYGRTWATEKSAQAWYFSGINRIIGQYNSGKVTYDNDVPNVEIDMKIKSTAWFEDTCSTVSKMRMYKASEVQNIAFWRIGQEDPGVWQWMKIEETK